MHANDTHRSWDCDIPLPQSILDTLHQRFAKIQLCVSLKTLDQPLVHSRQLHRLVVSLPYSDLAPQESACRWNYLKNLLIQCDNLRMLSLDAHPILIVESKREAAIKDRVNPLLARTVPSRTRKSPPHSQALSVDASPSKFARPITENVQLPLRPGDRLPTLEDLDIRAKTYDLDAAHCSQLLECMDWRKLKRLGLGPSNPKIFFDTFRDALPQLEALDFTYYYEYQPWYPNVIYESKLTACAAFIASIISLKDLVIRCDSINLKDTFWMTLTDTHGGNLKHLSIQPRCHELEAPDCKGNFNGFLACFSELTMLDLALRTSFQHAFKCSSCSKQSHRLVSLPPPGLRQCSFPAEHRIYELNTSPTVAQIPSHMR